jgi:hypothetical protein
VAGGRWEIRHKATLRDFVREITAK